MPSKRVIWTVFTILSLLIGTLAGLRLADLYIQKVNTGNWGPLGIENPSVGSGEHNQPVVSDKPAKVPETAKSAARFAFAVGGMLVAFLIWTLAISWIRRLKRGIEKMSAQDKLAVGAGLFVGLLMTVLISPLIAASVKAPTYINLIIAVFLCYLSVTAALSMKEQLGVYFPGASTGAKARFTNVLRPKILDTNVIIDGRIADVCKAGFIEGPIYVPRFVLEELQQIADSSDSLRRARGRRGLDILKSMQEQTSVQIETYDSAVNGPADDVDAKLVHLAKEIGGVIVTNDFNLNKVAALQDVKVLNVNELANALKPVVLPGEEMTVTIIKEGKEQNQGIGYLDDGTMVVVEHGRQHIGETRNVVVTSILQTPAGKMIFTVLQGDQPEDDSFERNVRSYSSGRQRRKIR
jgi:uncharacterized protein YacL